MKIQERLSRLNRLQHGLWFKVVASIIVAVLAIGGFAAYAVTQAALDRMPAVEVPEEPKAPEGVSLTPEQKKEVEFAKAAREAAVETARTIDRIRAGRADKTAAGVGFGLAALLALGVIWLGQGLTGVAVLAFIAAVCLPMYLVAQKLPDNWSTTASRLRSAAEFLGSLGVLAFAFVMLMELLRAALCGPWAVTAIARNVVNEAVRMKVSVIFIVMLLLGLAALPNLLDPTTPLRYRMQAFLQYGTGGTYWIVALLVLFLAVGTVAFEQRDRVIWQTMTKPVAAWQYLLGKWLGVVGVAAVLLTVSGAGVFMFAEYLRNRPALGEIAPFESDTPGMPISEDRLVLETQVLTARQSVGPNVPEVDQESLLKELQEKIKKARQSDENWQETDASRAELLRQMEEERRTGFFTIEGGNREQYVFSGLSLAKQMQVPVTLRYKIDVGANDPRQTWRVTFFFANAAPRIQVVPLGQAMSLAVSPASIDADGNLNVMVVNGDAERGLAGDPAWANSESMTFPPDGLEVFYPVGTFRMNFVRVMFVLLLKLSFLAMVAIWAGTFLSFSVASLVAFGVFLVAESAGFLSNALEYFSAVDVKGNLEIWKVFVRAIAVPIAGTFRFYADLRPTSNLVNGIMLSWATLIKAVGVLGLLVALLFAIAVSIFRKRELATYSGQ